MQHLTHRMISALAVAVMVVLACLGGIFAADDSDQEISVDLSAFTRKETIYFWYTDETMTDFFNSAAVSFGEERDVRVIPQLVSDSEYLEAINEATLTATQGPDVYLISNDFLEKAYLAGLACEVEDTAGILDEAHFSQTALDAVSCRGKTVAYPYFFETTVLLYNRTYLEEWVRQQTEETGESEEEDASDPGDGEEEISRDRLPALLENPVPETIDDILLISDTFDAPEGLEIILEWDVSDILYNYWFVGNYLTVGGDRGDDTSLIDVDNEQALLCLEVYENLNQFFSIDADEVTYDSVIEDFLAGKILFTVATTDVVEALREAAREGTLTFDYGLAAMPDISDALESRSLSVTNVIAVNGYSEHKELANAFAAYLTDTYLDTLYDRTGKVSANLTVNQEDDLQVFLAEYGESISLPKMTRTSNYWVLLEVLFARAWDGEDAATLLGELSTQLLLQTESTASQ